MRGLIAEKRFNEAIPYLGKAIKHMPAMEYAYNNRGHALLETGQLEQGVSDIKHSLKLDDTNAYVHIDELLQQTSTKINPQIPN